MTNRLRAAVMGTPAERELDALLGQLEMLLDALRRIVYDDQGEVRDYLGPDVSDDKNIALAALAGACKHPDVSFDRTLCACGSMHHYCTECGAQTDECSPAAVPMQVHDLGHTTVGVDTDGSPLAKLAGSANPNPAIKPEVSERAASEGGHPLRTGRDDPVGSRSETSAPAISPVASERTSPDAQGIAGVSRSSQGVLDGNVHPVRSEASGPAISPKGEA